MSENLQVALIAGLLSGGFALLGVTLSNWNSARREKRHFRTEAALELADTERLMWADEWIALNVHLQRQEARLTVAEAPPGLVGALRNMTVLCWRYRQEGVEAGVENPGISTTLLNARRDVSRAIVNHLLGTGRRSNRRRLEREALATAEQVWDDPDNKRIRDWGHPDPQV